MLFATVVLAAVAARDALASPIQARSPYVVKETHFVPKEWTKLDRAHGSKTIQLQIGLKQGQFEELDRHLYEGTFYPLRGEEDLN
jgi:tripeptidyl-peptidase-1